MIFVVVIVLFSISCIQKYNWSIGKNIYKGNAKLTYMTRIKHYASQIDQKNFNDKLWDAAVRACKIKNMIPASFGMNKSVIKKYFGTIKKLNSEIKVGKITKYNDK